MNKKCDKSAKCAEKICFLAPAVVQTEATLELIAGWKARKWRNYQSCQLFRCVQSFFLTNCSKISKIVMKILQKFILQKLMGIEPGFTKNTNEGTKENEENFAVFVGNRTKLLSFTTKLHFLVPKKK
jgi:hypothetical protein